MGKAKSSVLSLNYQEPWVDWTFDTTGAKSRADPGAEWGEGSTALWTACPLHRYRTEKGGGGADKSIYSVTQGESLEREEKCNSCFCHSLYIWLVANDYQEWFKNQKLIWKGLIIIHIELLLSISSKQALATYVWLAKLRSGFKGKWVVMLIKYKSQDLGCRSLSSPSRTC